MPPTPITLGAVVILVIVSMIAASALRAVGRGKAVATAVAVAILAVPVGYLGEMVAPAEHEAGGAVGGNAARGETLFRNGACPACHAITGISAGVVGPDLTHVAAVSATRKPGTGADAYLRESIVNPQAVVVPGFPSPSSMPPGLATGTDLEDIVAFLMTRL
ncbi:MAG: c-type cytochrome [Chloroflexi bacterium]|nr:c-type cytochrome [Chloroflexota bacterium]